MAVLTPLIRKRIIEASRQMELIVVTALNNDDTVTTSLNSIDNVLANEFGVGVIPASLSTLSVSFSGRTITLRDPVISTTNRVCLLVVGK